MNTIIPVAEPCLGQEELENVVDAVKSGWISSRGKYIPLFEQEFATYCGTKYAVATSNGTTALHLALKALGISEGDEVLVPALTFIATANAVVYCNATPVFIDSHPDYWCLDPDKIEAKITHRTKAIIPVHLYGHPCDMEPIIKLARKHSLYVIEDGAEAHGAEYKGQKVGSLGDINCFSFFGNKIITTGEGGMCLTNSEELAQKMRILRNQGTSPERQYWHDFVGFNYRMTNIQAAIGTAQLKKLDDFIRRKRKIVQFYNSLLSPVRGITLPPEMTWARSVYWMYCILINDEFGITPGKLAERLKEQGIETRPFFYPIHQMPPYKKPGVLPVAERLSAKGINLPSSVNLTQEMVGRVVQSIIRARERG